MPSNWHKAHVNSNWYHCGIQISQTLDFWNLLHLNLSFDLWHFEVTFFETILDSFGGYAIQDSHLHIINSMFVMSDLVN